MIIFINPPFTNRKTAHYVLFEQSKYPNPALTIFAGLFHKHKMPYLCIDAKLDDLSSEDLLNKIKEKTGGDPPLLFGVTNSNTTFIDYDQDMVRALKKEYPSTPIVMGGPHVSALPEETLENCKELDIICRYDGTESFLEIYDFFTTKSKIKSLEEINGINYRDANTGDIKSNPARVVKKTGELNYIKSRWEDFSKADIYYVYSGIGCPFECAYCFNATNRVFRKKPVENVIEELKFLISGRGMRHFFFADATFAVDNKNTIKLLQSMIDEGISEKVTWECVSRVDVLVSEELIRLMKKAGCIRISLGVESGSDKVLKRIHKDTNTTQIERAVQTIKKTGIYCKCFYVLGLINETKDDIEQTISMNVRINPDEIVVGVLTPWPGTEVYDLAVKNKEGYELLSRNYKEYDKWFGTSLLNKNISLKELNSLRNKMYLRFYLENKRYVDLLKFVWDNRSAVTKKAISLLGMKAGN